MSDRTLEQEQKDFESQLDALLKSHRGLHVLFKDGTPVAFFRSADEAYAEGLKRFGVAATFLVAPIERQPPRSVSLAWDAGVMFE